MNCGHAVYASRFLPQRTENVETFASLSGFAFDLVMGHGDGLAKGPPAYRAGRANVLRGPPRDAVRRRFSARRGDCLPGEDPLCGSGRTFAKERFTLRFPGQPVVGRFAEILDLLPNVAGRGGRIGVSCRSSCSPRVWAADWAH